MVGEECAEGVELGDAVVGGECDEWSEKMGGGDGGGRGEEAEEEGEEVGEGVEVRRGDGLDFGVTAR